MSKTEKIEKSISDLNVLDKSNDLEQMRSISLKDIFSNNEEQDMKREIVRELLTNNDMETKTELINPLRWCVLTQIKTFVNSKGLSSSASILQNFINTSFRYLISKERKGRTEYIEALKALSHFDSGTTEVKNIGGMNQNLNPLPKN